MKIVICGSMSHYLKMKELSEQLKSLGHKVILPEINTNKQLEAISLNKYTDTYSIKIKYDYIRKHYNQITKSDCVLIANYDKKGIRNYIGGNSFLEMGYAYIMEKPIFLLNPIPKIRLYYHEMVAMKPIIINNNLELISKTTLKSWHQQKRPLKKQV
jgi:nucleoside 2-deoxyribosyltransferase